MYRAFESLLPDAAPPPQTVRNSGPPAGLLAFCWHFIGQARGVFAAMLLTSLALALLDTLIPVLIGRLVALVQADDRGRALADSAPMLAAIAVGIVVGRPLMVFADSLLRHCVVTPGVTQMIRWQSHWHVVRQSWPFFQNEFAGRIASRVMQTGYAVRESATALIRAVWYILSFGAVSLGIMAVSDWRLAGPTLVWGVAYLAFLWYFVPRMRDRSRRSAEGNSALTGRIVDSYANILTVKLFARAADEDAYVAEAVTDHRRRLSAHMRMTNGFMAVLAVMNALLVAATAATGIGLWAAGRVDAAVVAMALPLAWQISNMAGWISWEIAGIFENVGIIQEGMQSIAVPHHLVDRDDATRLEVSRGEVTFERVSFRYPNGAAPVLSDFSLTIRPGERIGLVGRSGAGKSTLVNLLLRFFDVDAGRILIDGQEVGRVAQESLRAAIGMVTQDTSLLHRSIADNIRYGRPGASDAQVREAARQAHADEFVMNLRDWAGRTGYQAHAGERGVKLSGGQRQRIALARVILKDAPILVLDEATSALDSEIEAAIQEQLDEMMRGKTVIAIAHRLSTIARLDRLVVVDGGRIVEQGTHAELLERDGVYARLWRRQSGGFLGADLESGAA
ncbi:MAG TPA: ABC transporter ATP-binding protein [Burkholderiaceae bacterium]|nr:ABC transporter ATP-binding protein [Burkholderiaceae bacterium]